jgi:hypothetical protein
MIDERQVFERVMRGFVPPDDSLERLVHRRDRKRRNQRIAAGVVGIAVFVAAVWIVTTVGSSDRSTPAVPGGSETGPTQTAPPASPDAGWEGQGLPPDGTALSTPVEGELIRRRSGLEWPPFPSINVSVYADGRVLWWVPPYRNDWEGTVLERRLTPRGVDLVRMGQILSGDGTMDGTLHGVPASAWADAEARPYTPPMYSVCFSPDPSTVMRFLPARADALLRGGGPDPSHPWCLQVSTEEARALDEILSEAGFVQEESEWAAAGWFLREDGGDGVRIELLPLLPDGQRLRLFG